MSALARPDNPNRHPEASQRTQNSPQHPDRQQKTPENRQKQKKRTQLTHYRLLVEDEFVSVTVGLSQLIVLGKAKFLHFVFLGADTVPGFFRQPRATDQEFPAIRRRPGCRICAACG